MQGAGVVNDLSLIGRWAVVLFCLGGFVSPLHADPPKIATVDMQKLFKEYYRTVDAQERYNAEYAKIQKGVNERSQRLTRMRVRLRGLLAEIRKGEVAEDVLNLKKQEADMMRVEVTMLQRAIEDFSTKERKNVALKKAATMKGVMNEIRDKVAAHAKERGFDLVFDKSGKNSNQVTFFVHLRDAPDVTTTMLRELNKFDPAKKGQE